MLEYASTMKILVIDKPNDFVKGRNICIYELRKRHIKFHVLGEQFGITKERVRQIYLKMERLYAWGYFHYEDSDK